MIGRLALAILINIAICDASVAQSRPPLAIGHMSLEGGGPFPGHSPAGDHTDGTGIDMRPIRKDGERLGVRWRDAVYDREQTQQLVNMLLEDKRTKRVVFGDPYIQGTIKYRGFDDHLHVTVSDSKATPR
jgi:hypothetical protein